VTTHRSSSRGTTVVTLARSLVAAFALLATACSAADSSPIDASSSPEPALEAINYMTIPAPSLEGNLVGDAAERGFWVYLPPQYFESDEPMRTMYFLPNYGDHIIHNTNAVEAFDPAFAYLDPMIVVIIDGSNRFGGSFWMDSPVTGHWGTFIARDVVDYVDAHFRTIDAPQARGIAGHAMGGFGALDIAVRRPDVFGVAFAFAPWIARSVSPENIFSTPEQRVETVVSTIESVEGLPAADALVIIGRLHQEIHSTREAIDAAYGMAFAPITEPPFFDYPYSRVDGNLVLDDAAWERWTPMVGGTLDDPDDIAAHWEALTRVGIDCGSNGEYEWIPNGCAYLDSILTEAGVDHDYWPDTGGRGVDDIPSHSVDVMLPFFDEYLSTH
jgi:enterochelin esterase-like enzyme